MSVFNNFEITFTKGRTHQSGELIKEAFSNSNFEYEYYVSENLDGTTSLEVDIYGGEECSAFRDIFQRLCESIVLTNPDSVFMGRHVYDFTSKDSTKYMLAFYKDEVLTFYSAEVVDDVNRIDASMYRLAYENENLKEKEEHFFKDYIFDTEDDSDDFFFELLEDYDLKDYPDGEMTY